MKEYDITIRETLEMTVTVEAESREEARQKVADNWKNGEYILDAESFKDVCDSPAGNGTCMYQQASCLVAQTPLVRGSAPLIPL